MACRGCDAPSITDNNEPVAVNSIAGRRRAAYDAHIMANISDNRRYITNFGSQRAGHVLTDILVIGSGVAGSSAAIEATKFGRVTLITKGDFQASATATAQGGVAVASAPGDSPTLHFEDTMRVGGGLNNAAAVDLLVKQGPARIETLLSWGWEADRSHGALDRGREAGHSLNRILHAAGDQTGRVLAKTLFDKVQAETRIRVFEHCFLIDLITVEGKCLGAVTYHKKYGHQLIWAKQTILASGGCGQIWRETTNPPCATADGAAVAYRAGAVLRDMEMVQFHPTTLYIAGAGRALISEAVRGEGAYLVDADGHRIMADVHPDGELAPRDIVSRAIHDHLTKTRTTCAYLDVRHIRHFGQRFPYISQLCHNFQIDPAHDLIPVRPSAHYMIGGVAVDLQGTSSLDGLLCCGEVASTGVHGANRLASNSLLEGLVFGATCGETAGNRASQKEQPARIIDLVEETPRSARTELDLPDIDNSLRSVMWRNVGIIRSEDRLDETNDILKFWAHYVLDKTLNSPAGWQTQNKLTVAIMVTKSARERDESRGVHFRSDAPTKSTGNPYHVLVSKHGSQTRVEREPL